MYLYLVQHAEAMSKEADPSRSLTEQGMEDIRRVAGLAAGMKIRAHQIIHSGKMRALQTAQAIGAREHRLQPSVGRIQPQPGLERRQRLRGLADQQIDLTQIHRLNGDVAQFPAAGFVFAHFVNNLKRLFLTAVDFLQHSNAILTGHIPFRRHYFNLGSAKSQ